MCNFANLMKIDATEQVYLEKAQQFCAADEQCAASVMRKLADWGCPLTSAPKIVDVLTSTGYIDENRYVCRYCESKAFHQKWGRIKITSMLRQKHIPGDVISKGIKTINEEEYRKVLREVANTKWATYTDDDNERNITRLTSFLLSRGYEIEIIKEITKDFEQ